MAVYYVLFLSFGYFYIILKNIQLFCDEKKIKACLYGSFVFLLLAFRHQSMGIDLGYGGIGYLSNFQNLASFSFEEIWKMEHYLNYAKGYIWLNWILGFLFGDAPQVLLIGCASLSIIPVVILFYKESVLIELSFIIYLSLQSFLICFSGLRQGVSVGFCMLSFFFITQKSFFKFICMVVLASWFHSSAILFIIAYPAYYLKISKKIRWVTILLVIITYVFKVPLFVVFSKILKDHAVAHESSSIGAFFIIYVAVYIICFLYAKETQKNNGLLNLTLLACFCLAFNDVYSTAMRASYCFMNMLPLLIPNVLSDIKEKNSRILFQFFVVLAFSFFGLYELYSTSWTRSYPYMFFWE